MYPYPPNGYSKDTSSATGARGDAMRCIGGHAHPPAPRPCRPRALPRRAGAGDRQAGRRAGACRPGRRPDPRGRLRRPALRPAAATGPGPSTRPRHLGLSRPGPSPQGAAPTRPPVQRGPRGQDLLGGRERRAATGQRHHRPRPAQGEPQGDRLEDGPRCRRPERDHRLRGQGPRPRPHLDRIPPAHRPHPPDPRARPGAGLPGAGRPRLRPQATARTAAPARPRHPPAAVSGQAADRGRRTAAAPHARSADRVRL